MVLSISKSFLKYELIKPEDLHLITRKNEKVSQIGKQFSSSKVSPFEEVKELDSDLIIIAVKPQDFQFVVEHISFGF